MTKMMIRPTATGIKMLYHITEVVSTVKKIKSAVNSDIFFNKGQIFSFKSSPADLQVGVSVGSASLMLSAKSIIMIIGH